LEVCDRWYVVGYGFNDEFIFEIFKEAMYSNKQLIIINPNAKELRKKFPDEYQENIKCLPIKFGGKYFAKDFTDFVHNKRTIQVEIQTESDNVAINFPLRIENSTIIKNDKFDHGFDVISHDDNESRIHSFFKKFQR